MYCRRSGSRALLLFYIYHSLPLPLRVPILFCYSTSMSLCDNFYFFFLYHFLRGFFLPILIDMREYISKGNANKCFQNWSRTFNNIFFFQNPYIQCSEICNIWLFKRTITKFKICKCLKTRGIITLYLIIFEWIQGVFVVSSDFCLSETNIFFNSEYPIIAPSKKKQFRNYLTHSKKWEQFCLEK